MTDAPSPRVMVVDDDPFVGEMLRDFLVAAGLDTVWFDQPQAGLVKASAGGFDVILLDLMMPGMDGLTFLRKIKEAQPSTQVVMLTARQEMTLVDRALKLKAFDYLVKPASLQKLIATVRSAMTCRLQRAGSDAPPPANGTVAHGWLVAGSESARLLSWARAAGPYCATALIHGPAGSGKSHLARVLHAESGRPAERFVHLDLAALADTDQETALLGGLLYWKSAPVGALKRADGGSVLLENVERLSGLLQRRVLLLLDTGQLDDPPSVDEDFLDVKILATTSADIGAAVATNHFSPDLARKLALVSTTVAPLPARVDEVVPLATHFLEEAAREAGRPATGWTPPAERQLSAYPWPGDVEELKAAAAHAGRGATTAQASPADLPESVRNFGRNSGYAAAEDFLKR